MYAIQPRRSRAVARALAEHPPQTGTASVDRLRRVARLYSPSGRPQPEGKVRISTGANVFTEAAHLLERHPSYCAIRCLRVRPGSVTKRVALFHRTAQDRVTGREAMRAPVERRTIDDPPAEEGGVRGRARLRVALDEIRGRLDVRVKEDD